MLGDVGLDETSLQCPPEWPLAQGARRALLASGHRRPQRVHHNCSGKHAALLRACIANDWDPAEYLNPDQPLQRKIHELITKVTGVEATPVGVDGCGASVMRGTLRGLAQAFATLSVEPRFAATADAMHRFPSLVADNLREDGRLARWWAGPLKVGAEGLIAASRRGVGIAVKSRDGSGQIAALAMVEVLRRLGMLPAAALEAITTVAEPPVLGGDRRVGAIEPDIA